MTAPDFSVAEILAWARTKPADELYFYVNPWNCALCRFLRDTGRAAKPEVDPGGWWADRRRKGLRHYYPRQLEPALGGRLLSTFGALVARLEKLCPDAPVPPSEWTRLNAYMADIETVSA